MNFRAVSSVYRGVSLQIQDADALAASVGQPAAFAVIYERHSPAILRYMRRRLGSDVAEDATVDVFERAFAQRGRYQARYETALPWLYWIAGQVISDRGRAERRRLKALDRLVASGAFAATSVSAADDDGLAAELVTALLGLSKADRETLLLVVWGELSYEETALVVDVPVGTVRSRIARARRHLQKETATLRVRQRQEIGEAHA